MVTLPPAGGRFGAVYEPPVDIVPTVASPPTVPLTCHVTAVLLVFTTFAVNVVDDPAATADGPDGVTAMAPVLPPPPELLFDGFAELLLLLHDEHVSTANPRTHTISLFTVIPSPMLVRFRFPLGLSTTTSICASCVPRKPEHNSDVLGSFDWLIAQQRWLITPLSNGARGCRHQ